MTLRTDLSQVHPPMYRVYRGYISRGYRANCAKRLASGRATGWLAPGRRADFMVLDANHPALAGRPPQAWLSGVVFGETGGTPIRDVYVGGVQRVAEGRHADEERARADYLCALNELLG